MTFRQLLGRQCRPEVQVELSDQSNRMVTNRIRQAVVRGATASLVGDRWGAAVAIPAQQPIRLPRRYIHKSGRDSNAQLATIEPRQNIKTIQFALAHQHHAHRNDSLQSPKRVQKLTSELCSVLTF